MLQYLGFQPKRAMVPSLPFRFGLPVVAGPVGRMKCGRPVMPRAALSLAPALQLARVAASAI
jgi:hypothetical protein